MSPCTSHSLKSRWLIAVVVSSSALVMAQTPPSAAPVEPAASAAPATPAPQKILRPGVVKIGEEMKETLGRVTDLDKADNGCFLILRNDRNGEIIELGKMEFCTQKPSLKGKKVELEYRMETVQAATCYGDPKCKKTETLPLVVGVKVLE
jgi:hypothetical protein